MASVTFKTNFYSPSIPVKLINPDSGKTVTIGMRIDTGTNISRIHSNYAKQLGLNLKDGEKKIINTQTSTADEAYKHELTIQIGNLKPIKSKVLLKDPQIYGLLGWEGALEYYNVIFNGGTSVTFTELMNIESKIVRIRSFNKYVRPISKF